MKAIHRFVGDEDKFDWEEIPVETNISSGSKGVIRRWLIGEREKAPYFAMRYYEVKPGGWTDLHKHSHDHGVIVLKGNGKVFIENEEFEVKFGDVIYIAPYKLHQLKNTGSSPFGFICVIPNKKIVKDQGSNK